MHKNRSEKHKLIQDASASTKLPVPGDVCYWKKTDITEAGVSTKLFGKYIGPCIIVEVDTTNNSAYLRHLRTGKYFPHKVSISHLKCPVNLRSIPCSYNKPIPMEDELIDADENHLLASQEDEKLLDSLINTIEYKI